MSYLLDRKIKRKKFLNMALGVLVLLFMIYFRADIFRGLAYASHAVFRPVLILGNNISGKFSSAGSLFRSKSSLLAENKNLKFQLNEMSARISNYNLVLDENSKLKEILGRKDEKNLILASILSKPNQSLYDTVIIDAGTNQGIAPGQKVFASGDVPIGRVAEVYANSSKVILFSSPGEKTEAVIAGRDVFMQIVGRGGGNFEMILPRNFVLGQETEVHLPGLTPYVLGIVKTIISDPRDSFQKALLVAPVNIQELKFVEVEVK